MAELLRRPAVVRVGGAVMAVVLLVGLATLVSRRSGGAGDGFARLHTTGRVLVVRVDGRRETIVSSTELHDGDVVEAQAGAMSIDLPGGATLEGRPGVAAHDPTRVHMAPVVELLTGDLLVASEDGVSVDAAGNRVRLDSGVARLRRSLALAAAVYRGALGLDSAGQHRSIPALREIEVSVLGRPPVQPRALKVDPSDAWDQRFLGSAIQLGLTLKNYSRTYTSTLRRDQGRTAAFFQSVLPPLREADGFDEALLAEAPDREQGETLVGAGIALLGRKGSFTDRWNAAFAFRADGADWGLVALDQSVSDGPLLDLVTAAIDRTPFQFAQVSTRPTGGGVALGPISTAPAASGGADGTTTTTTTPGSPPTTTPAIPPTTLPPVTVPSVPLLPPITTPPGPGGSSGSLTDPITGVLGGLLGGLLGTPPPSSGG